jgi:hypothetical protein
MRQETLDSFKYVTVYRVTRHYGGPEEGGWWYNWYEPVHTEPYRTMEQRDELQKEWRDRDNGDIYSVLGGEEYRVYAEAILNESATTERPHYE